jgi:transcriptional regulator with XRE-family HTH domain
MTENYFADRLRELREAKGWSQQELGDRAGLHMQTVSRFERGTLKPTWENVLALADILGVDCRAFCQRPAAVLERRGPGRPKKDAVRATAELLEDIEQATQAIKGSKPKGK